MIESYKDPINKINTPEKSDEDILTEQSLRPSLITEFVGQKEVVENLHTLVEDNDSFPSVY